MPSGGGSELLWQRDLRCGLLSGAQTDLDEIESYLALRFSERNAERYLHRIMACCRSIALAPYRGTKRDEIRPGLRTIGFEGLVSILFQVTPERIVILGVFYAGRRLEGIE